MNSKWEELDIENKIEMILRSAEGHPEEHHFGHPFLTAYQLAIAFAQQYPNEANAIGFEVGGEGIGQRNSLAQYLAHELSSRIHKGIIRNIEGRFLSNQSLREISFNSGDDVIISSLTNTQFPLSMFRLLTE
jgi:hypothetical protein